MNSSTSGAPDIHGDAETLCGGTISAGGLWVKINAGYKKNPCTRCLSWCHDNAHVFWSWLDSDPGCGFQGDLRILDRAACKMRYGPWLITRLLQNSLWNLALISRIVASSSSLFTPQISPDSRSKTAVIRSNLDVRSCSCVLWSVLQGGLIWTLQRAVTRQTPQENRLEKILKKYNHESSISSKAPWWEAHRPALTCWSYISSV